MSAKDVALLYLQSCSEKYKATKAEKTHTYSSFILFRIYRSQQPRNLTHTRSWPVPALRSRVRNTLILYPFAFGGESSPKKRD
jgi:hypothetical protein